MHSLDELVSVLDRLIARLDELETRVVALERNTLDGQPQHAEAETQSMPLKTIELTTGISFQVAAAPALDHAPVPAAAPENAPVSPTAAQTLPTVTASVPAAAAVAPHPIEQLLSQSGGSVAAIIGKVFLGVAGAYVLRAVAESGAVPELAVISVALLYAASWLLWAARVAPNARFASAAYAATSAFIGTPMLWELTLRFKVLPDALTALLLLLFVVTATALAWKRELTSIAWIAALSATLTSIGLLIASRDPAPFAAALTAMALLTEVAACLGRTFKTRALVAAGLDLAVVAIIVVYTAEQGVPPEYQPLSTGLLLAFVTAPLLIYGASVAIRNVFLRCHISVLDISQTSLAFLLAWFGVLRATHNGWAAALGVFCIATAAASYFIAFTRFQQPDHPREYHVYGSWAALLLLAGSWQLLPANALALFLSVAALCGVLVSVRRGRLSPAFHGLAFLLAAALVSGLFSYTFKALFESLPTVSFIDVITAVFASACYVVVWRLADNTWQERFLRLLFTATATLSLAGFAVFAIAFGIRLTVTPDAPMLAVVRTLVICGFALALTFAGSRWDKAELIWCGYGAMALCTLKLLFDDLRSGSTGSMAASLFLYGLVWLMVPRIVRSRSPRAA